jgi:hypothetical protein
MAMTDKVFPIPKRGPWENAFFRLTKRTQGTETMRPQRFENEVFLITEPGARGPNFLYKPTGFAITYPDYVFKGTTRMNQSLTTREFITIISKCIKSLKAPKKPTGKRGNDGNLRHV